MNGPVRMLSRWITRAQHNRRQAQQREQLYNSGANKTPVLDPLSRQGGVRNRTVHVIGPHASSDGIGWDEEKGDFIEGGVQTTVVHRQVRRCDCGTVLAYGISLIGTCSICGRTVCSWEEGSKKCAQRCSYCGALVCRRHSLKYRGRHVFCTRHRLVAWWRIFWGILE